MNQNRIRFFFLLIFTLLFTLSVRNTFAKNQDVFLIYHNGKKISVETIIGTHISDYRMPWRTYIPNTSEKGRIFNKYYHTFGSTTAFGLNSYFGGVNYKAIKILQLVTGCYGNCRIADENGKKIDKLPRIVSKELLSFIINHEKIIKTQFHGGDALWKTLFDYVTQKDDAGNGRIEKGNENSGAYSGANK